MATKKKAQKEETPATDNKAYEAAKAAFQEAKAEAGAKWDEVKAFQKKHKLKPGTKPSEIEDKKVAKEFKALIADHKAAKEKREELEAEMKSHKPASTVARGKYTYPEGLTNAEKKKLRAKWRAEAKKAAKAEAGEDAPKKSKKAKKSEEPAVAEAPAKKSKKAKKAAKVEDEDED